MWHTSTRGFWSKKNSLIWILIARLCVSAQYLECTAPSYDKLGFKCPLPEHNLEAFSTELQANEMEQIEIVFSH